MRYGVPPFNRTIVELKLAESWGIAIVVIPSRRRTHGRLLIEPLWN